MPEPTLHDVGEPADPVDDHRREPGGEELERHRTTHGHGTPRLGHQASRPPRHDLHRTAAGAGDHLPDDRGVTVMEDGHDKPGGRNPTRDDVRPPQERRQVSADLLPAGSGEEEDEGCRRRGERAGPRWREGNLVEKGMADERRGDPLGREPLMLERQRRQDMIDQPAHLLLPPARPRPDLRWAVEDHGDPVPLRAPRQPPVESGEVDEHAGIGTVIEEAPLGAAGEIDEPMDRQDHPQEPHHRQPGHVGNELDPLGGHLRPAEPDALDVGAARLQRSGEEGGVVVAGWLAGREEDAHGRGLRGGRRAKKLRTGKAPVRSISSPTPPP